MTDLLTAAHFIERLEPYRLPSKRQEYECAFKPVEDDVFFGVPMGQVFELAKEFMAMPLDEIEKLLESPIHEALPGIFIQRRKAVPRIFPKSNSDADPSR